MVDLPPLPKKRRSFGFWAAIVIVASGMLYPLSLGPAYWIASRFVSVGEHGNFELDRRLSTFYRPLLEACGNFEAPDWRADCLCWYAGLALASDKEVAIGGWGSGDGQQGGPLLCIREAILDPEPEQP